MKKCFFSAFFVLISSLSVLFASSDELKNEMLDDLKIIQKTLEVKYAPTDWKQICFGWDLNEECKQAQAQILNLPSPSLKDYHKILRNVFLSAADYHVNVVFHSTEASYLPFKIQGSEGRYFITWFDATQLPPETFDWEIGDEILTFDGKSIDELVESERLNHWNRHNKLTDQRFAEFSLTLKTGLFAEDVSKGPVVIELRSKRTAEVKAYTLNWDYFPEQIKDIEKEEKLEPRKITAATPLFQKPYYAKEMLSPLYPHLKKLAKLSGNDDVLAGRKSFLPSLGKIIWETSEQDAFHAYIFETPSRVRVGYLRIASYMGGEAEVKEFAKLIELFQQRTQALVIDQVNNPGGLVFYQYALLSMLSDKPLHLPTYQMTLTQEDIMEALESIDLLKEIENDEDALVVCGESLSGYPVNYELVQDVIDYFQFILHQWDEGKHFTDAGYLLMHQIEPAPISYKRPLIVLTNEFDFSCGDTMPAILQDNQRALIFGSTTAGAGGTVSGGVHPNRLGIAHYTYTTSILQRQDQSRIENVGVKPDVNYTLTPTDYQNDYRDYVKALQATLDEHLKRNPERVR